MLFIIGIRLVFLLGTQRQDPILIRNMDLFLLEPRHIASDLVMILLIFNIDLRDSGVILIHRRHIIIKEVIQNRIAKQTIKWNQTTHIKDLFLFIFSSGTLSVLP